MVWLQRLTQAEETLVFKLTQADNRSVLIKATMSLNLVHLVTF